MKKEVFPIPMAFSYNPERKGAHYTLDGTHWMNAGQFKQIVRVAGLFGRIEKPDHVPYDVDSDIPELHESIKSSKATLVNMVLGEDMAETLNFYFAHTVSTVHSWVTIVDDDVVTYIMDNIEFRTFTERFASYNKSRKVVRYGKESALMIKWLEDRLEG